MAQRTQPLAASDVAASTPRRLKEIRLKRNLTQERLAALSGVSRAWLGFLERCPECMTPTAAEKLAAVLGVRVQELLP